MSVVVVHSSGSEYEQETSDGGGSPLPKRKKCPVLSDSDDGWSDSAGSSSSARSAFSGKCSAIPRPDNDALIATGDSALRELVEHLDEVFESSYPMVEVSENAQDSTIVNETLPAGMKHQDVRSEVAFEQKSHPLETAHTHVQSLEERFRMFCGPEATFLDEAAGCSRVQLASQDNVSDFYGMPGSVRSAIFKVFHITKLHQWQESMLTDHLSVGDGKKNALVHAPTSGGKTLIAVVLLLRTMLLEKRDGILVLPYVALVIEKVQELKALASQVCFFTVVEYAGSKGSFPVPNQKTTLKTLYVCTPEKALIVWQLLCAEGSRKDEIGLVAVDECHMISDSTRGIVLEELFVSLLKWSTPCTTILALSATVGNVKAFRSFLGGGRSSHCLLYSVLCRLTRIKEHMVVSGMVIPIVRDDEGKGTVSFSAAVGTDLLNEEQDQALLKCELLEGKLEDSVVVKLVIESMENGQSTLIFCNTRKMCNSMCDMLTGVLQYLRSNDYPTSSQCGSRHAEVVKQRTMLIAHLKRESQERVNSILLAGIVVGIGVHSAELHPTERSAVEDSFRRGILCVLCCTTTLAAGVNLPASRVVIRSPLLGSRMLSCAQYLQMARRAGRTGQNYKGTADSYVLVQPNDAGKFQSLLQQHVADLDSQLGDVSSHYVRSRSIQGVARGDLSGLTRILLLSLSIHKDSVNLSELIDVFRLTLFYQCGLKCPVGGEMVYHTHAPFVKELLELVRCGHISIQTSETQENHKSLELTMKTRSPVLPMLKSECNEPVAGVEDLKELTHAEVVAFTDSLAEAIAHPEESVQVADYFFRLSCIARAASAASLSVADAEKFVEEAEHFEKDMNVQNPLLFFYISLTVAMCKPLVADPQYKEAENTKSAWMVGKLLARDFQHHPDVSILTKIGLQEEAVMEWVVGNPTLRSSASFVDKLTRTWSALFLKELIASPDSAEKICADYGFDRALSLEFAVVLASRLQNLKCLSRNLGKFWWYPPLATHLGKLLEHQCSEEVRPLLALRHVTIGRAKDMIAAGLITIHTVAKLIPPTLLCEKVNHLSKYMAVEIVQHARMLVAEQASLLQAESLERRQLLL